MYSTGQKTKKMLKKEVILTGKKRVFVELVREKVPRTYGTPLSTVYHKHPTASKRAEETS